MPPEHGEFENPQVAQDYGAFLKQQMAEREYLEASEKYQQRMAERINLQTESLCAVTARGSLADTLVAELSYAWPPANKEPREVRLQRAAEVQNCLALLGLAGMPLDTRLDTLSGGQQRRVAIATQLARRPTALLLDEPFAGLDWQSRRGLLPLLRAAAQDAGRAVLIVSHDSDELREVADAEYRMEVGGTIARV